MDPMIGSALISAGSSIFGGLFGGKKKQTTERNLNFQKIRDDGAAAGFNPLTALAAASGAGVGTTTTTAPSLSTAEFLGEIASKAADSWFNSEQEAKDEEIERIKLETMRAELANIQARTDYMKKETPFGASIPQYSSDASPGRLKTHGAGPLSMYPPHGGRIEKATEIEPMRQTPALSEFRSGVPGAAPYLRPNPDAADMGLSEGIAWGVNHGLPLWWDTAVYDYNNPKSTAAVGQKKVGDWIAGKAGDVNEWLHEKDDEFFEWNKRQARALYNWWSKPGKKSGPSLLNGGFMN